ncbi:MAG: 2-phospho-L-lactate transferase [SAR324 cluster bacterium]|nr:2-phospho-L-lactate transferase [SAR324 cluster bacterium]
MSERVTLLSGGVGGAKLALGLYTTLGPGRLAVVANTGDDIELFGLHISPDCDILTYTLAGRVNGETGWGIAGDTFHALGAAAELGGSGWFALGDRDLGVHLYRTERLRAGEGLAAVTQAIADGMGLSCTMLPMCEAPVPTQIGTDEGELHLQEYLVRRRCEPRVTAVRFDGIERATPAPGVAEAIAESGRIVIAPSNPLISIGPILAVPGFRTLLERAEGLRIAVSPIVGGEALKGPTAQMMRQLGYEVSPVAVAEMFRGIVDVFVVDERDAAVQGAIESLGMRCIALPAVMDSLASKQRLARELCAIERKSGR